MSTILVQNMNAPTAFVNGVTIPTGFKPVGASDLLDGLRRGLAEEYAGPDEAKKGKPKVQLMVEALIDRAIEGDLAAIDKVFDRVVGRPTQTIASLSITSSLRDFLDGLDTNDRGTDDRTTSKVDPLGD